MEALISKESIARKVPHYNERVIAGTHINQQENKWLDLINVLSSTWNRPDRLAY